MNKQHRTILLAAAMLLSSCGGGDDSREEVWQVNSHEAECVGVFATLCLMVRSTVTDPWTLNYDPIDGFQYSLGTAYEIRVRISSTGNSMVDGSSFRVQLLSVTSALQAPRSAKFQVTVSSPTDIQRVDAANYVLFGRRQLACDAQLCAQIEDAIAASRGVILEFDHTNSPNGLMNLLRIPCSAPTERFRQACPLSLN